MSTLDTIDIAFAGPTLVEFKLAAGEESQIGTFEGYLARYGNQDDNGDVLEPGAFGASVSNWRKMGELPPMLLNHAGIPWGAVTYDSVLPIGIWTEMNDTADGLLVKGRLDPLDTDLGKRIYAGLRNRTLKGLSVGYKAQKFTRGTKAGDPRRWIKTASLIEGSVVHQPANVLATIDSVKSSVALMAAAARARLTPEEFDPANIRHLDTFLREVLSRSQAKALLAGGYKAMTVPRDAGRGRSTDPLTDLRHALQAARQA